MAAPVRVIRLSLSDSSMIEPPSDRFFDARVTKAEASALARNLMPVVSEPFRMLPPSKAALSTADLIAFIRAWKSAFSSWRDWVFSEVSFAAVTFSLSWFSRSEIDLPADRATSAIEVARSRLCFTAPSAPTSARWVWAMAQIAALSLAPWTFRPVETRLCTSARRLFVVVRFCSAICAATLVWTLFVIRLGPSRFGQG